MSIAEIKKCLLSDILPLTVKFLGVADANFPEGSRVADGAPYTLTQIKKLIFQADYEIALMISGNLDHPYRAAFVTGETEFLADGDLIPPHFGQHSQVTLKIGEDYEELGMPRDYSRLKRIRKNPDVYGNPQNLYAIFGGRIHFANSDVTGKLDLPHVEKDATLTVLISPLPYFWAIIAGAITSAAMPGFPEAHRRWWMNLWMKYESEIKSGAVAIPEPEQLERLGT